MHIILLEEYARDFTNDVYNLKGDNMKEIVFFFIGLMVGGATGVTIMCCLQVKRINENSHKNK